MNKLKKMLVGTFAMMMAMSATSASAATNYVVWSGNALTANEEQLPVDWYGWHNMSNDQIEDENSPEGKCVWYHATNGGADASSGVYIGDNGHRFNMSLLADMDLVFYAKRTGEGNWVVRLTGKDSGDCDCTLDVPADGEYHPVRLNVKNMFNSKLYSAWSAAAEDEAYWQGYVFALVGSNLSADASMKVADIHYEAAAPGVTFTVETTETTATLSYEMYNVDGMSFCGLFDEDGEYVEDSPILLEGLTPNTEYSLTFTPFGIPMTTGGDETGDNMGVGEWVVGAPVTVTFKTKREAGNDPVWYNSFEGTSKQYGNTYNISVDYNITYNSDKTLTVCAKIEGTDGIVGLANRQISFIRGLVEEWKNMTADGDEYVYTTTGTVEEGTEVEFFFWLPYAEGVFGGDYHQTYVAGAENEAPIVAPSLKASAKNVTFNSAEIAYELKVPASLSAANVKVYYKAGEGEAVEATANPILLEGLTENTEYTYSLYAVATLGEETYTSKDVTVSFKTPLKDAVDKVYADYTKSEFKNAYLVGEEATEARSFFVSLPWMVTYTTQGTAKYEVDLSQVENIVGLNPQIWSDGFRQLTKNAETGMWEYDFGAKEEGAVAAISHYFAYAGGVYDFRCAYTSWGMEQELPELTEATAVQISASKQYAKVKEPVRIATSATDAHGYYLPASGIEIEVPNCVVYDATAGTVTAPGVKGTYTITAKSGEMSATTQVSFICAPEAKNVALNANGTCDEEYLIEGTTPANALDGNVNTELRWGCAETEEHFLMVDLKRADSDEGYFIEAVTVLFEGAYAKDFTITLTNTNPSAQGAAYAPAQNDVTWTVTDGNTTQHLFMQNPTGTHRYLVLNTTKALNAGWGIKIKKLEVYGTAENPTTSISTPIVIDANAPVEYYNLQGVRVENPTNGLYIRRQGNTASKVIFK